MENKQKHGKSFARERAIKSLYSYAVLKDERNIYSNDKLANEMTEEVIKNLDVIDACITKYLRKWSLLEINQVNLSILRLATYEIKYTETKSGIVVNEALELAKKYSDNKSKNFIHGVLDNIVKE